MSWTTDWTAAAACKGADPDSLFVQGAEQNRAKAIQMLKARLYEVELQKREAERLEDPLADEHLDRLARGARQHEARRQGEGEHARTGEEIAQRRGAPGLRETQRMTPRQRFDIVHRRIEQAWSHDEWTPPGNLASGARR